MDKEKLHVRPRTATTKKLAQLGLSSSGFSVAQFCKIDRVIL